MARGLVELIDQFALPLLAGGDVAVSGPIRPREHDTMTLESGLLGDARLRFARLRRAQLLVADPELPDPDLDELALWVGLHNVLALDHPERGRVWARAASWRRAEGMTRTLLTLGSPIDLREMLARHVSVGPFVELCRDDVILTTPAGELRFFGQTVPRRRLRLSTLPRSGHRSERVMWLSQPHASESERLIEDAMWASPLTCLLSPLLAPRDWSPLSAVACLQERAFARAVCHAWAGDPDWIRIGGAVTGALCSSLTASEGGSRAPSEDTGGVLALPGTVLSAGPEAIGAVVGALTHLHFIKVLEFDARLGAALGSRDSGILSFLALPLLLPSVQTVMGTPLGALETPTPFETQVSRRWTEYVDHLAELVPRHVVENLLATLVDRIVKRS